VELLANLCPNCGDGFVQRTSPSIGIGKVEILWMKSPLIFSLSFSECGTQIQGRPKKNPTILLPKTFGESAPVGTFAGTQQSKTEQKGATTAERATPS
jgi:hypothetical protein